MTLTSCSRHWTACSARQLRDASAVQRHPTRVSEKAARRSDKQSPVIRRRLLHEPETVFGQVSGCPSARSIRHAGAGRRPRDYRARLTVVRWPWRGGRVRARPERARRLRRPSPSLAALLDPFRNDPQGSSRSHCAGAGLTARKPAKLPGSPRLARSDDCSPKCVCDFGTSLCLCAIYARQGTRTR